MRELAADAAHAARTGTLDAHARTLAEALRAEVAGKSPKVIARFASGDAGAFALTQWRLLSRLSADELAALSSQHAEELAWLLADRAALSLFLASGEVEGGRWGDALRVLLQLAAEDPEIRAAADGQRKGDAPAIPPLALRLAVATALVHAAPVKWMADGSTIDPVRRYRSYRAWDKEGVLFASFRDLSAWELRYVVGSWSSDADLVWARANIKPDLKVREKVGDAAHMLAYNLVNKRGVSVQEGGKFYDDKPMTLAVMLEYGGVCGAISRFGSSMSQAFGVPAMPVGQPGHCAFIWQQRPGSWAINNDISGWAESGRHDGIQITWSTPSGATPAWLVPVMQEAQGDLAAFARSEAIRSAAELCDSADRAGVLAEACTAAPSNFGAWLVRFDALAAPGQKPVKQAAWRDVANDAAAAFVRQPLAFDALLSKAEPALLPAKASVRTRGQHLQGVGATALSMAESGADLGLADALVRNTLVRQASEHAGDHAAEARGFVLGEAPGAGSEPSGKLCAEVLGMAFEAASALDVAKEGPRHELWRRSMGRIARGVVLQPAFRDAGLRRLEATTAALVKSGRLDDARWLVDRMVEASKDAKDPKAVELGLEARLAQYRASLG